MKIEQTDALATMSDDELREGIARIEEYLAMKRTAAATIDLQPDPPAPWEVHYDISVR